MNEARLKLIEEKVDSIQWNLDLHIKDTDKEIGDLGQLRIDVATLQESVNELRKSMSRHTENVQTKMAEVVQPMIEETQDLRETIKGKKVLVIQEKTKSFLKKFWNWWTIGWR